MEIRIKQWFEEKVQREAKHHNVWLDLKNDENGIEVIDGYVTAYVDEVLAESEKAIKVRLYSGSVVGSVHGWVTWIPKSVIA